jgi:hypothetical protein
MPIDFNFMEKTLILGECKWDRHPIDQDVLTKLIGKTESVLPPDGKWKVYYLGFARSGWTEEAIQFARGVKAASALGDRWQAAGMLLRNLQQVNDELDLWTV